MRQESVGSVHSLSSALSNTSLNSGDERDKKLGGKRSGWLRSSFSKAFAKSKNRHKSGSVSDCEDNPRVEALNPSDSKNESLVTTSLNDTIDQSDDEVELSKLTKGLTIQEDSDWTIFRGLLVVKEFYFIINNYCQSVWFT